MRNLISKAIRSMLEPKRSPHWPAFRANYFKEEGCYCHYCGSVKDVELHHIQPYHLHPELELVRSNVIGLCESFGTNDHLHIGHLGDWKSYNPRVREQATHPRPQ